MSIARVIMPSSALRNMYPGGEGASMTRPAHYIGMRALCHHYLSILVSPKQMKWEARAIEGRRSSSYFVKDD